MDNRNLDNSLLRQAYVIGDMVQCVYDSVLPQLPGILSVKEAFDAQKIYITGCGDSYLAGVACKAAFEAITKIETYTERAIDFSRFLDKKKLGYSPNTPLVFIVSFSGEATRAVECAMRATGYGANTVAVTAHPNSRLAKACRKVLCVGLPDGGEYFPGSTTYSASVTALLLAAMYIGRCRNTISGEEYEKMKGELTALAKREQAAVEQQAEKALALAVRWKDLRAVDFIGDYSDYATAFFGSAKVIEVYGGYTTYDDSEDWCHINYFLANPETIGRVVVTNRATPSYGRIQETLAAIKLLESPCVVVSDAPESEFPADFSVFTTPQTEYFWLLPLVQHIPFGLVAGYIGALQGETAFRADNPAYATPLGTNRLGSGTEIRIV